MCCSMYCLFVLLYVLFVCKRVLYYCHRVSTQLQLNISYHMNGHTSEPKFYIFGNDNHSQIIPYYNCPYALFYTGE
jgi:hypothetical protein